MCAICAGISTNLSHYSLGINLCQHAIERSGLCSLNIVNFKHRVIAIIVGYVPIAFRNLLYQCTAVAILIEMRKSALVAQYRESVLTPHCCIGIVKVNPRFRLLFVYELRHCRARVHCKYLQMILVAVERCHHQSVRCRGILDSRNISISINGQLHRLQCAVVHIIAHHTHRGVFLSCNGIFILKPPRIQCILSLLVACSLIDVKPIHRHFALVPTKERECEAVGRPCKSIQQSEFFLIHPVGHAVDYLVALAIGSHRHHCAIFHLPDIHVVVLHKCHHSCIGRHCSYLLASRFAQLCQLVVANLIHIVVSLEGVAINLLLVCPEQYPHLIVRHFKAFPIVHLAVAGCRRIKHHCHIFAGAVATLHYAAAIVAEFVVIITIIGGNHLSHPSGNALAEHKVLHSQSLSTKCRRKQHQCRHK